MVDLYERLQRFKKNTTPESGSKEKSAQDTSAFHDSVSLPNQLASLPNQLRSIPGLARARDLIGIAEKRDRQKRQFLESIGVEEAENGQGKYGVRNVLFPVDELPYPPGDIRGDELVFQMRDESLAIADPETMLFLDTETTGLGGGTGTVPFLIGVGFFEGNVFRVQQYLMRDYDEEPAVLMEIDRLVRLFPVIATYNGKGFDIPILRSRFLLNRIHSPIEERLQADFLYPARRFWREMLPNCTLLCVEQFLTGKTRIDDIPGELIPMVYFDFLRGLRIQRMQTVLNHNVEDIRTLPLIASRTCRMIRQPWPEWLHGLEMAALGRMYAAVEDWENACCCLEQALQWNGIPPSSCLPICKNLSILYKRLKRYANACSLWKQMIQEYEDPFAYIELAKFYEHRERNYAQALFFTSQAVSLVQQNRSFLELNKKCESNLEKQLNFRFERLRRKTNTDS